MNELYNTMGVSIKKDVNTAKKNNTTNVEQQKQTTAPQNAAVTNNTKNVQEKSATVVPQTTPTNNTQKTQQKKSRYSLSWGEIGKQALKSTGNFFKGMFCDEKGFSLKRTATTVGIVAGTAALAAVSAPAALVVGAGLGLYMAYEGGKKLIKGRNEYYKATTKEEAQAAMEEAMDGGVEATMGVAALFGVKKGYSSLKQSKATTNAQQSAPEASTQSGAQPTPRATTETSAQTGTQSTPRTTTETSAQTGTQSTPRTTTETSTQTTPEPVARQTQANEPNPDYDLWLRKENTIKKHAAKKTEASNTRNEKWLEEQHNIQEQEYSNWWNKELAKAEKGNSKQKAKKEETPVRKKVTQEEVDKALAEKAELESSVKEPAKRIKEERKISQEVKKHNKANKKEYNEAHQIQNNAQVKPLKEKGVKTKDYDTQISEEIKSIEGSISRLRARISGAKRFGKDTKKLENELANLEKKLEQRKLDKEVPFLY